MVRRERRSSPLKNVATKIARGKKGGFYKNNGEGEKDTTLVGSRTDRRRNRKTMGARKALLISRTNDAREKKKIGFPSRAKDCPKHAKKQHNTRTAPACGGGWGTSVRRGQAYKRRHHPSTH